MPADKLGRFMTSGTFLARANAAVTTAVRRTQVSSHSTVLTFVELVVAWYVDDRQAAALDFNPRQTALAQMNVAGKHNHVYTGRVDVERGEFEVKVT
ncbi:hypothetical protein MAFF211479_08660 [Ralstonia solanacearum]|nr:hypothetical protein MAFF211479_08660 [Ralstonia solanacearum]BCL98461.1 hypothetical protein MAFF211491_29130 [Ralstonia solanacearum]BCM13903.1 hypothetical protein MAFF241648_30930 [Ralstonia solanacearum]BCN03728.1 hypothetical protein RPSB_08650 [Ralstonia solanacearum]